MKNTKTIYLVDDDPDDMMFIREALQSTIQDIKIIEAADGKELLDLIMHQNTESSIILMDMNMPRVNGLEALSVLKSNPATKHIPVIMISTTSDPKLIRQAYNEGINAYIIKPCSVLDYNLIAQAVNVCFLDYHVLSPQSVTTFKEAKERSILIIEDNDDQWELMKYALGQSMPDVDLIRMSGRDNALNFLTDQWNTVKTAPEIIFMDLYLPTRREGLNLLDSIRYFFIFQELSFVPIIVFSSSDQQEDIKECYRHRANAYLIKSQNLSCVSSLQDLCYSWWNTVTFPMKTLAV